MEHNDIYAVFDSGGALSSRFPAFEYRQGQLDMALAVADVFSKGGVAVIEAGTGIGKSFAYLVPAVLHAFEDDHDRTIVATSTINLQRQLYDKDLVQLFGVMESSCPTALLMGRNNYLCLRRLEEQIALAPLLANDGQSPLGALLLWSEQTETGLKSDLTFACPFELWQEVCSDADLCYGYGCRSARDCFFMKSRKKAAEAKIVVVNHHLLFTDARSRAIDKIDYDQEAVLPAFSRLIIDEAHNIERNATDFLTETYSSTDMMRPIGRISRQRRQDGKGALEGLAPYCPNQSLCPAILGKIANLVESIGLLDTWLLAFMQMRKSPALLVQSHMHPSLSDFARLSASVVEHASDVHASVTMFLESSSIPEEMRFLADELTMHMLRIEASASALALFIDFPNWTDDVYWFESVERGKGQRNVEIHISPLSVASRLRETLFSKLETVVCTSATLDLGDDFAFWSSRVGLPLGDGRPYLTAVHPSPFDFKNRLLLLTPSDAPVFSEQNPWPFMDYCVTVVRDAILSSQGGALVLFTSYGMLMKVSEAVTQELGRHGIRVLRQGESDRTRLLKTFLEDKDSVLFATDSFWEGVDAPGDTLRLVIIAKLPFKVPSDPVFKARQDSLDSTGKSGFFQLALPEATMKLKQGFGRLLRNTLDSGVVLILDSRVVQKSYGAWMLKALPDSFHPETDTAGICDKIENFLYNAMR